jgi:hypothetical protein
VFLWLGSPLVPYELSEFRFLGMQVTMVARKEAYEVDHLKCIHSPNYGSSESFRYRA